MQLNELISINRGVSTNVRAKLDECTFVGIDFGTSTTTVTRLVYDADRLAEEDISAGGLVFMNSKILGFN